MCFAGWAAQLDGGEWLLPTAVEIEKYVSDDEGKEVVSFLDPRAPLTYQGYDDLDWVEGPELLIARPSDPIGRVFSVVHPISRRRVRVITASDRAKHVLGLTDEQAETLFEGSNTFQKVQKQVETLIGEKFF